MPSAPVLNQAPIKGAQQPAQQALQAERAMTDPHDEGDLHAVHEESDDWETVMRTKAPPARPGYAQRWVRLMVHGQEDASNVMRKRNEGWSPRPGNTLPPGFFAPVVEHASMGNVIANGDMILMERPLKVHERQARHNEKMTNLQVQGVERYLAANAPGGRGFGAGEVSEFSRRTTTGRRPKIADD